MKRRLFGWETIYGADGEHATPYLTRIWLGRLRLHIFHRGDADPDPHDHPWDFWTFPLVSYIEEVTRESRLMPGVYIRHHQVARAFRWSFRPATHMHRVLGPFDGAWIDEDGFPYVSTGEPLAAYDVPQAGEGRIVTLVWRGKGERNWGFLKFRDGRWCWTHWRDYVFGGGKHAPCTPVADKLTAADVIALSVHQESRAKRQEVGR